MDNRFYLLKIYLSEINPQIWRRFVVPATISLDRLHDVIQIVMGWTDSHLHQFSIGNKRYTEDPEFKEEGLECGKYRLGDLIKKKGREFEYLYDFGDSWRHCLVLEDSRYDASDLNYDMECLEGERACPPEDVGGVPGYHQFCKILNNPNHKEYEETRQWIGGHYDPEKFDIEEINWELAKYLRWSRDRYMRWGNLY